MSAADALSHARALVTMTPTIAAFELATMWRARAQRAIDGGDGTRAGVWERAALDICFAMGIPLPPRPASTSSTSDDDVDMARDARAVLVDAMAIHRRGYAYRPGNARMLAACEWLAEAGLLVLDHGSSSYDLTASGRVASLIVGASS